VAWMGNRKLMHNFCGDPFHKVAMCKSNKELEDSVNLDLRDIDCGD
jgi:hypothetical protein